MVNELDSAQQRQSAPREGRHDEACGATWSNVVVLLAFTVFAVSSTPPSYLISAFRTRGFVRLVGPRIPARYSVTTVVPGSRRAVAPGDRARVPHLEDVPTARCASVRRLHQRRAARRRTQHAGSCRALPRPRPRIHPSSSISDGRYLDRSVLHQQRPWSVPITWSRPVPICNRFRCRAGHFLGLAHSAPERHSPVGVGRRVLGEGAVRFPIAFASGTVEGRRPSG